MTAAGWTHDTAPRLLSWLAIALLGGAAILSVVTLREEWTVRQTELAVGRQDMAIRRGEGIAPPPGARIAPSLPARAQMAEALYLARAAAPAGAPMVRKAMLDEAAAAIGRAIAVRPNWGEAWAVGAYIHALRDGPAAAATRRAFARSYAGAPYLRHAAEWRVAFGLSSWSMLTPPVRRQVIDEGIWLARTVPQLKASVFAMVRQTPAYVPFLLRWREMRAGDDDLDKRLGLEREQARQRPSP